MHFFLRVLSENQGYFEIQIVKIFFTKELEFIIGSRKN